MGEARVVRGGGDVQSVVLSLLYPVMELAHSIFSPGSSLHLLSVFFLSLFSLDYFFLCFLYLFLFSVFSMFYLLTSLCFLFFFSIFPPSSSSSLVSSLFSFLLSILSLVSSLFPRLSSVFLLYFSLACTLESYCCCFEFVELGHIYLFIF